MSDFLATLAARVRPSAPPIEPRRASLFELPARNPAPVESAGEQLIAQAAPGPAAGLFASPEISRPPAQQFQPAPVSLPTTPKSTVAPPDMLPAPRTASAPIFDSVRAVANDRPPSGPIRETISLLTREVPAAAPVAPPVAPSNLVIVEKIISAPAPAALAPAVVEPRPAPPAFQTGPLLATPAVRLIEPASPASPHASDGSATSATPAIHVTIGRVEVRAVVPPAAQQRPARSSARKSDPVIPLDDYLKQQGSRNARA